MLTKIPSLLWKQSTDILPSVLRIKIWNINKGVIELKKVLNTS